VWASCLLLANPAFAEEDARIPPVGGLDVDWSYPIVLEVWVETEAQSRSDARLYNSLTHDRGLVREEARLREVPFRAATLIISRDHKVGITGLSPHPETQERMMRLLADYNSQEVWITWHAFGKRLLPDNARKPESSLFPIAVLLSLIENGYTPYIGGVNGWDIADALWRDPITE
jgi:hypothetical protein